MPSWDMKNGSLKSLFVGFMLVFSTAAFGTVGYIYSRDMDKMEQAMSQIAMNQKSIAVILSRFSNAKEDRYLMREQLSGVKKRSDSIVTTLKETNKEIEFLNQRVTNLEEDID